MKRFLSELKMEIDEIHHWEEFLFFLFFLSRIKMSVINRQLQLRFLWPISQPSALTAAVTRPAWARRGAKKPRKKKKMLTPTYTAAHTLLVSWAKCMCSLLSLGPWCNIFPEIFDKCFLFFFSLLSYYLSNISTMALHPQTHKYPIITLKGVVSNSDANLLKEKCFRIKCKDNYPQQQHSQSRNSVKQVADWCKQEVQLL